VTPIVDLDKLQASVHSESLIRAVVSAARLSGQPCPCDEFWCSDGGAPGAAFKRVTLRWWPTWSSL